MRFRTELVDRTPPPPPHIHALSTLAYQLRDLDEEDALCSPIYVHYFRKRSSGGKMILPTKPQAPRPVGSFPKGKTWLFFGPPKIGKTNLASQFPKPYAVDLEDGWSDIGGMVAKPTSLDEMSELMTALEGPYGKPYESVIIDTLDVVHDWIEEETVSGLSKKLKMELNGMGEAPQGLDWAVSRKSMMGFIEAWRYFALNTGKNVVFTAHATAVMEEKGTVTQKAMTIDFPGKLGRRIPSKVDAVGYCYGLKGTDPDSKKQVINRMLSFQPYSDLAAGCRFKELSGKVIPMSFKAIAGCFAK